MTSGWRSGFGIPVRLAATAPAAALILVAIAQVATPSGDIREGVYPWFVALAAVLFSLCCFGLLAVHAPDADRWVLVGSLWAALAFLGLAGGFLAIAVGGLLGIDEEAAGPFGMLPLIGLAFGFLSMAPALIIAAVGATRRKVLPKWGRVALRVEAPLLPLLLIYGGVFEDSAETIGSAAILGLMAI
ncbi:MAG TPA: hypothetical protein VMO52_09155 [Acidimicrobiia bacterium]|nr:hypothetical protein [Acidimicrobiia bacterium]